MLPPETFSLDAVTYKGLPFNRRLDALHHKDVYERYLLNKQVDAVISYTVITARKFAAWIVGRTVDRITTLDNREIEESLTPSFINLAEFSRL